ncbi:hypothetical protein MT325_m051L [Paramecium bursaria chlorella virus MT325]|uniref:Uncharacterized protein m051L n=1 Tax=Paramecium bursaria Chlorella virus MT325 TaxID=346932 RepID=A7ITD1_PBCVM|nr:hypothetical protein MT325_m051L [Paramecium bursaria chlorella virus MT325]
MKKDTIANESVTCYVAYNVYLTTDDNVSEHSKEVSTYITRINVCACNDVTNDVDVLVSTGNSCHSCQSRATSEEVQSDHVTGDVHLTTSIDISYNSQ